MALVPSGGLSTPGREFDPCLSTKGEESLDKGTFRSMGKKVSRATASTSQAGETHMDSHLGKTIRMSRLIRPRPRSFTGRDLKRAVAMRKCLSRNEILDFSTVQ